MRKNKEVAEELERIREACEDAEVQNVQNGKLLFPFNIYMNSMKLVILLHYISWKKTPNDAVTAQRQSQFAPKMKANAVPRLLSSLV